MRLVRDVKKGSPFWAKNRQKTVKKRTVIYHGYIKPNKRDPKAPTNFFKLEHEIFWL